MIDTNVVKDAIDAISVGLGQPRDMTNAVNAIVSSRLDPARLASEFAGWAALIGVVTAFLGRYCHAVIVHGGIVPGIKAVLFGTNTPALPKYPEVPNEQAQPVKPVAPVAARPPAGQSDLARVVPEPPGAPTPRMAPLDNPPATV